MIYISLGTHFTLSDTQTAQFVEKMRNQSTFKVVWSLSKMMQKVAERLKIVSDGTIFFSDYLPQYTLLSHERVTVFVTHGGLGSIIDLVKHRKPSVCTPQVFDQFYNCGKLTSLSIAETASSFDFETINETIQKILRNYQSYVIKADELARNFELYENRETIDSFLAEVAAKGRVDFKKELEFKFCPEQCDQAWNVALFIFALFCAMIGLLMTMGFKWCWKLANRRRVKVD